MLIIILCIAETAKSNIDAENSNKSLPIAAATTEGNNPASDMLKIAAELASGQMTYVKKEGGAYTKIVY